MYATIKGETKTLDTYDFDIAGGDIMCLVIQGIGYFLFVFIIEFLREMKTISQIIFP